MGIEIGGSGWGASSIAPLLADNQHAQALYMQAVAEANAANLRQATNQGSMDAQRGQSDQRIADLARQRNDAMETRNYQARQAQASQDAQDARQQNVLKQQADWHAQELQQRQNAIDENNREKFRREQTALTAKGEGRAAALKAKNDAIQAGIQKHSQDILVQSTAQAYKAGHPYPEAYGRQQRDAYLAGLPAVAKTAASVANTLAPTEDEEEDTPTPKTAGDAGGFSNTNSDASIIGDNPPDSMEKEGDEGAEGDKGKPGQAEEDDEEGEETETPTSTMNAQAQADDQQHQQALMQSAQKDYSPAAAAAFKAQPSPQMPPVNFAADEGDGAEADDAGPQGTAGVSGSDEVPNPIHDSRRALFADLQAKSDAQYQNTLADLAATRDQRITPLPATSTVPQTLGDQIHQQAALAAFAGHMNLLDRAQNPAASDMSSAQPAAQVNSAPEQPAGSGEADPSWQVHDLAGKYQGEDQSAAPSQAASALSVDPSQPTLSEADMRAANKAFIDSQLKAKADNVKEGRRIQQDNAAMRAHAQAQAELKTQMEVQKYQDAQELKRNPARDVTALIQSKIQKLGPQMQHPKYDDPVMQAIQYEAAKAEGVPLPPGINPRQDAEMSSTWQDAANTHKDLTGNVTSSPQAEWLKAHHAQKDDRRAAALYAMLPDATGATGGAPATRSASAATKQVDRSPTQPAAGAKNTPNDHPPIQKYGYTYTWDGTKYNKVVK